MLYLRLYLQEFRSGDGLPSMASVDIEDASFSESSDLQKARKLYAELQAMSMESTGSTEVGIHAFIYL